MLNNYTFINDVKSSIPPKIEDKSSTILVVEEAFFMLEEAPLEDDVLFPGSDPPLF